MKCPFCFYEKTYVKTCGSAESGFRRYRKCPKCQRMFTTLEQYDGFAKHLEKNRRTRKRTDAPKDNNTT